MPKKAKPVTINFQFKAVEVISASLSTPKEPLLPIQNFNFNINVEQKFDKINKFILVLINIIIDANGSVPHAGEILISNVFFVENYEEIVIEKDGIITGIDDKIAVMLNSISISTARGVLSQYFKGTWLHNAILPVIDPANMQLVKK